MTYCRKSDEDKGDAMCVSTFSICITETETETEGTCPGNCYNIVGKNKVCKLVCVRQKRNCGLK